MRRQTVSRVHGLLSVYINYGQASMDYMISSGVGGLEVAPKGPLTHFVTVKLRS